MTPVALLSMKIDISAYLKLVSVNVAPEVHVYFKIGLCSRKLQPSSLKEIFNLMAA